MLTYAPSAVNCAKGFSLEIGARVCVCVCDTIIGVETMHNIHSSWAVYTLQTILYARAGALTITQYLISQALFVSHLDFYSILVGFFFVRREKNEMKRKNIVLFSFWISDKLPQIALSSPHWFRKHGKIMFVCDARRLWCAFLTRRLSPVLQ